MHPENVAENGTVADTPTAPFLGGGMADRNPCRAKGDRGEHMEPTAGHTFCVPVSWPSETPCARCVSVSVVSCSLARCNDPRERVGERGCASCARRDRSRVAAANEVGQVDVPPDVRAVSRRQRVYRRGPGDPAIDRRVLAHPNPLGPLALPSRQRLRLCTMRHVIAALGAVAAIANPPLSPSSPSPLQCGDHRPEVLRAHPAKGEP